MAVVREPRHQRLLAREFNLIGGFVSPELEPSIQPTAIVADLVQRDEMGDAPYYQRCGGSVSATGDATHGPSCWIRNPVANTKLIIVRRVYFTTQSENSVSIGPAGALAFTGNGQTSYRNLRLAGQPTALIERNTNAGPPAVNAQYTVSVTDAVLYTLDHVDAVLVPGGLAYMVFAGTANGTLVVSFDWDEVALEP